MSSKKEYTVKDVNTGETQYSSDTLIYAMDYADKNASVAKPMIVMDKQGIVVYSRHVKK